MTKKKFIIFYYLFKKLELLKIFSRAILLHPCHSSSAIRISRFSVWPTHGFARLVPQIPAVVKGRQSYVFTSLSYRVIGYDDSREGSGVYTTNHIFVRKNMDFCKLPLPVAVWIFTNHEAIIPFKTFVFCFYITTLRSAFSPTLVLSFAIKHPYFGGDCSVKKQKK